MQFEFIADRPVLDFVATMAERGARDEEKLRTPADLADWVAQSGLVDERVDPTSGDLARATTLREALFAVITALIDQEPVRDADRELVNAAATRPRPVLTLLPDQRTHRSGDLDGVLATLACDLLDLAGSPDRQLLHWCADRRCTRPFVDRSHGHRRRWCGMKGCGDRAKAVAYRRRQRSTTPTE